MDGSCAERPDSWIAEHGLCSNNRSGKLGDSRSLGAMCIAHRLDGETCYSGSMAGSISGFMTVWVSQVTKWMQTETNLTRNLGAMHRHIHACFGHLAHLNHAWLAPRFRTRVTAER